MDLLIHFNADLECTNIVYLGSLSLVVYVSFRTRQQ